MDFLAPILFVNVGRVARDITIFEKRCSLGTSGRFNVFFAELDKFYGYLMLRKSVIGNII